MPVIRRKSSIRETPNTRACRSTRDACAPIFVFEDEKEDEDEIENTDGTKTNTDSAVPGGTYIVLRD
jgi:hypothetical protein